MWGGSICDLLVLLQRLLGERVTVCMQIDSPPGTDYSQTGRMYVCTPLTFCRQTLKALVWCWNLRVLVLWCHSPARSVTFHFRRGRTRSIRVPALASIELECGR